jgi:hypothetical protein
MISYFSHRDKKADAQGCTYLAFEVTVIARLGVWLHSLDFHWQREEIGMVNCGIARHSQLVGE